MKIVLCNRLKTANHKVLHYFHIAIQSWRLDFDTNGKKKAFEYGYTVKCSRYIQREYQKHKLEQFVQYEKYYILQLIMQEKH